MKQRTKREMVVMARQVTKLSDYVVSMTTMADDDPCALPLAELVEALEQEYLAELALSAATDVVSDAQATTASKQAAYDACQQANGGTDGTDDPDLPGAP